MSLVKQVFVLDELDQVGKNAVQHALIKRLVDTSPTMGFYIPSSPHLNFPDANAIRAEAEREGWSISFTYPLSPGDVAVPTGLATLYVDIKNFVEAANGADTFERAMNAHGVISGQMNQYMSDVLIGHWLLSEAFITGVSIDEAGVTGEKVAPTSLVITVDFSAYIR